MARGSFGAVHLRVAAARPIHSTADFETSLWKFSSEKSFDSWPRKKVLLPTYDQGRGLCV